MSAPPDASGPLPLLQRALRLHGEGALSEAEAAYVAYLDLAPQDARARAAYAEMLASRGRHAEAIEHYRRALHEAPELAEAASNLALALCACSEFEEAEEWAERAVASKPDLLAARLNLGVIQQELGKYVESASTSAEAVRRAPESPVAHYNLAQGLARLYRLDASIAEYRRALELDPDFVDAHWSLSHVLLLTGNYHEGWQAFEWRWRYQGAEAPQVTERLWRGENLEGKRIFVWSEQGYGDTLQFIRYVPLLAERGARVTVHTRPPLVSLLKRMPSIEHVGEIGDPVPAHDYQCPVMSLPRGFGTTTDTIPARVPYLAADPAQSQAWKERLDPGATLRVGLVWSSGIRTYRREVFYAGIAKSMALAQLNPLGAARGVQFVSLQTGAQADEAARVPTGMRLSNWSDELRDFDQTAALIEALDLVITVDTAVAHLAGALGKPVWVLVRYHGCWRWMHQRTDSPWYPGMRLFRQREPEDWSAPVREAADALCALAAQRPSGAGWWRRLIFGG